MWQKADIDRVLFLLWSVLAWILALVRFCNVSPRRYRNLDAGGGRNPRIIYWPGWHLSAHACHPSPIAPSTAAALIHWRPLHPHRQREGSQFTNMLPIHPSFTSKITHYTATLYIDLFALFMYFWHSFLREYYQYERVLLWETQCLVRWET